MKNFKSLLRRLPFSWRLRLQLALRVWRDRRSGLSSRWAQTAAHSPAHWQLQTSVTQVLKAAPYSENKRHNLLLGIQRIEPIVLLPGQVFSFWRAIGEPNQKRGFVEGRALVNDRLQPVVGGGLCQLSGLMYIAGLQAGLKVVERHAHSQDIYTDETRFTPLGSDATVVYGYKDLRLENPLDVAVQFRFVVARESVTAAIYAPAILDCYELDYAVTQMEGRKYVKTLRRPSRIAIVAGESAGDRAGESAGIGETIAETIYR